jgi:hypothetical protein
MALLRSARDDDPPPDALPRAMIAAGIGGAALSGGAATSVLAKPAGGLLKWALNLMVVAACGLGAGAIFMGEAGNSAGSGPIAGRSAAALAGSESNEDALAEALSAGEAPAATELLEPGQSENGAAAGSPRAPQKSALSGQKSRSADSAENTNTNANANANANAKNAKPSLAEEVALLDSARRALMGGDAMGALRVLERHARVFSGGALIADAAVLRIEALAARGDTAGAISNARAFLSAFPRDPHATHVQDLLHEHQGREPGSQAQVGDPK